MAGGVSFLHAESMIFQWKFTVLAFSITEQKKKKKNNGAQRCWDYNSGGLVGHMTPFGSSQNFATRLKYLMVLDVCCWGGPGGVVP